MDLTAVAQVSSHESGLRTLAQGRIQQLWSLLSGVQSEMQKEFDVGATEGTRKTRMIETMRTRSEPDTWPSEPAASHTSQSSGSEARPPRRSRQPENQNHSSRRRAFDSKWTESCAALMEASCIQLGVDVHAPWKLRWVRTGFRLPSPYDTAVSDRHSP